MKEKVVSEKCKSKRCLGCLNVSETDVFQSFQTKKQYKINDQLNCNDKCLIYLLSCKVCGLQYVGSTTDKFRLRWNNYKENNQKARGEEHIKRLQYYSYWQNRWVWSHYKRGILEKSTEDCYSIWVQRDRLIVLFGQITSSNTHLWYILLVVFIVYVFRFHIL